MWTGDVAQGAVGEPGGLEQLQHPAPEPARHDALLERHDEPLAAGLVQDELAVERLGEPGVDDADGPAVLGQGIGGLERPGDDRPEADEQHVAPVAEHLAAADRDDRRLDRRQAEPGVARVVQRERMVLRERRVEQRSQLLLIARARDDEVRQLALGRQHEHALVAGPVLAHEAGAIHGDQHRLVVLTDVVDGLVECPLEEGRVERDDRSHPAQRQAGRERDRVLLGDANVEEPLGELGLELCHPGAGRHAGGDAHDPAVGPGHGDELFGE